MIQICAVIEKTKGGEYGIYAVTVKGACGYGLTEEEAKNDFLEALNEQAEYYRKIHGSYPGWYAFPFTSENACFKSIGNKLLVEQCEIDNPLSKLTVGSLVLVAKNNDGTFSPLSLTKSQSEIIYSIIGQLSSKEPLRLLNDVKLLNVNDRNDQLDFSLQMAKEGKVKKITTQDQLVDFIKNL